MACKGFEIMILHISGRREFLFKIPTNLTVGNTISGISKVHKKNEEAIFDDANLVKYIICTMCQQKSFWSKNVKSYHMGKSFT